MIIPFFGDQNLWASRIEELGVGIAPYTLKRLNKSELSARLTRVVTGKQMQEKAVALGKMLRSQDGVTRAEEFFHSQLRRYPGYGKKLIIIVPNTNPSGATENPLSP